MGLTLRRNLGTAAHLDLGEYVVELDVIYLCCPICGRITLLDRELHTVARDGKVTPAFRCPSCPLHDWLMLSNLGD